MNAREILEVGIVAMHAAGGDGEKIAYALRAIDALVVDMMANYLKPASDKASRTLKAQALVDRCLALGYSPEAPRD